jgi:hypothetical protein
MIELVAVDQNRTLQYHLSCTAVAVERLIEDIATAVTLLTSDGADARVVPRRRD